MPRKPSVAKTTIAADTTNMQVGQDQLHQIQATGKLNASDFVDQIDIVDGPNFKTKAAALAFMEEIVVVMVHTTPDKTREAIPCVSVNGVNQYLIRGKHMPIKRKFVEALARAVEEGVSTPFGRDANGFDTYNIAKTKSLKYPFAVVKDANPNGTPWLNKILAEA